MSNLLSGLDFPQVIKSVYDRDRNCLRVCVVDGSPGDGGGIEVIITHTEDSIRLGDGSKLTTATTVGSSTGLDVFLLNEIDIRDLDHLRDSVSIGDPDGDILDVQPDGSIITRNTINSNITSVNKYNEIASLASGSETTLVTHTAPGGRDTFLQRVDVAGDNIAKYRVKVNGTTIETKRTYFGGDLEKGFIYDGENNPGLKLTGGDIVTVTVIHGRSMVGDFEGKIQVIEVV